MSNNLFRAVGFVEHFSAFEAFFIAGCLLGGPSIHSSIYQPIFQLENDAKTKRQNFRIIAFFANAQYFDLF